MLLLSSCNASCELKASAVSHLGAVWPVRVYFYKENGILKETVDQKRKKY